MFRQLRLRKIDSVSSAIFQGYGKSLAEIIFQSFCRRRCDRENMPVSPTQRTLAHLRKAGYPLVQVVERWNPYARVRQDLFGIIDVLAVGPAGILGVQCTSAKNLADRRAKLRASGALPVLKAAGVSVRVHGWRKSRPSGRWVLRDESL